LTYYVSLDMVFINQIDFYSTKFISTKFIKMGLIKSRHNRYKDAG